MNVQNLGQARLCGGPLYIKGYAGRLGGRPCQPPAWGGRVDLPGRCKENPMFPSPNAAGGFPAPPYDGPKFAF
jgi:hypothetical protein